MWCDGKCMIETHLLSLIFPHIYSLLSYMYVVNKCRVCRTVPCQTLWQECLVWIWSLQPHCWSCLPVSNRTECTSHILTYIHVAHTQYTSTCTPTHTKVHMQTYIHKHIHNTYTCTCIYNHVHTHTHSLTHSHTHTKHTFLTLSRNGTPNTLCGPCSVYRCIKHMKWQILYTNMYIYTHYSMIVSYFMEVSHRK